jgi:hypothetical protein
MQRSGKRIGVDEETASKPRARKPRDRSLNNILDMPGLSPKRDCKRTRQAAFMPLVHDHRQAELLHEQIRSMASQTLHTREQVEHLLEDFKLSHLSKKRLAQALVHQKSEH